MNKILSRENKGITLISLVITIIVLLILAAVSIGMLFGENGILTQAEEASEEHRAGSVEEQRDLWLLEQNIKKQTNDDTMKIETVEEIANRLRDENKLLENQAEVDSIINNEFVEIAGRKIYFYMLETGDTTKPETPEFIPDGFTVSTDPTEDEVSEGMVATDEDGNEWVWVEVPKTIYTNVTSSEDYENIETDMKTYTADYTYTVHPSGGVDGEADEYVDGMPYFTSSTQYDTLKHEVLKSIYEKEGFWVSRYEIGNDNGTPVSVKGAEPYNMITFAEAQSKAETLGTTENKASMLFGFQWNLILKFMEESGEVEKDTLQWNAASYGNYFSFDERKIVEGKYSADYDTYIEGTVINESTVIMTTGFEMGFNTSEENPIYNKIANIYDIAGNVSEFTLETFGYMEHSVHRGGNYMEHGWDYAPVHGRTTDGEAYNEIGFRAALH